MVHTGPPADRTRARRVPSASFNLQAARFKEAPPRRSPEPMCWRFGRALGLNQARRTKLLA
ncbi:hypothetical protein BHE74_00011227 [Ensete ventricosum]|nr:hypothetical protein BHE74_00011227 [Ensete ventricosum]